MIMRLEHIYVFLTALLLCNVIVIAQFGEEPKFCPPYQCPKGQEPVPKWPLKLESTGCGGMGGMQMFSPGSTGDDKEQRKCCDIRNACLQTCGSMKAYCDTEFLKCSKDACSGIVDEEKKKQCETSATVNELMVKMDTCQKFDTEQYTHCECIKKDKVMDRREQILRNFYKKYAPDSVDKVPTLAKKVDNSSKMVGLLIKLYKKYYNDGVIKKVKDPQQEYMDNLMKEAREKKDDGDIDDESNAEDLGTEEL